jgi:hypothetical protein
LEELQVGLICEFTIDLSNVSLVALNVTKLRSDQDDRREYMPRPDSWQARVVDGQGSWRVMNDLDRLDNLLVN